MAKLTVVNIKGEQTGEIDLSDEVFGITEINQDLFYEIVKAQLASRRAGNSLHQGPRRGGRVDEEALQAEGHRQRAARQHPRADLRQVAVKVAHAEAA
jgi:ribosomal protein L4